MTVNAWTIVLVGAIGMIAVALVGLFRRRLAQIGKQLADTRHDQAWIVRQVARLVRRVDSVSQKTRDLLRATRAAKREFGRSTPLLQSMAIDAKNAAAVAERDHQELAAIGQGGLSRLEQLDALVRTFHLAVTDSFNALAELAGRIDGSVARLASRHDLTSDLQAVLSRLEELNTALGSQGRRLAELHTMLDRQQGGLNDVIGALDGHTRGLEDVRSALAGHGRGVEQCAVALNGVADDVKGISRTANVERDEILGLLHA